MQCPVCKTVNLTMADRSGIEIDYCPQCRGVWLDRGELDKILERATAQQPAAPVPSPPPAYDRGHQQGHQAGHQLDHRKPKRKESWLSELFD
jgi:Zn-finger nucleic acid-binding protein